MKSKVCTGCNVRKHISEFYYRADSPDKHRNWCKSCMEKAVNKHQRRVAC